MGYRNHCNVLQKFNFTGGRNRAISSLLEEGTHTIEIWGNSREGFKPYLVSGDSGVSISSGHYTRRKDCRFALQREFGLRFKYKTGRNWI